jgi:uncharacterized protein YndB with AHSA1/START domain
VTRADGTLVVAGEIAVIAFERRLGHPVEAVWAALTEPEELAAWLGPGKLEPREGGQVSIYTGPKDRSDRPRTISGRVLAWDPPRVLEHEWLQPGLDTSGRAIRARRLTAADLLRLTASKKRGTRCDRRAVPAGTPTSTVRRAPRGLPVPAWAQRRSGGPGRLRRGSATGILVIDDVDAAGPGNRSQ